MKILIIGCGSIGKRHISNLKNFSVENILAQDIDKQRCAEIEEEFGIKVYEGLSDCFQTRVNAAVIIAAPNSVHVPIATECAKHKCHFLKCRIVRTSEVVHRQVGFLITNLNLL